MKSRVAERFGIAVLFQWRVGASFAYVVASFLYASFTDSAPSADVDARLACFGSAASELTEGEE